MYRLGEQHRSEEYRLRKRRRRLIVLLLLLALLAATGYSQRDRFKSKTTITQARPVTQHVDFSTSVKHYDLPNFSVDIPGTWQQVPRPVGPYTSFTWQYSSKSTEGQVLTVYEDTIPVNFAANRVQIVEGQGDHVNPVGTASDNCATFTKATNANQAQEGIRAKWQGIDFLCDLNNTERNIVATSSSDGINMVKLRGPTSGSHTYFFTYTTHAINPNYVPLTSLLTSFKMK